MIYLMIYIADIFVVFLVLLTVIFFEEMMSSLIKTYNSVSVLY